MAPEDCQNMSMHDVHSSPHTLMMTRRTLLGAPKCAFRDLRRELATTAWTLAIVAVKLACCRVS